MNKDKIKEMLVALLENEINKAQNIADNARFNATDTEMKQEGKYDTRAIEAGYLAGAQSKRLNELKLNINLIKNLELIPFEKRPIAIGALVLAKQNEVESLYFVSPCAAGPVIKIEDKTIVVVSAYSPIGKNLIGCESGDYFQIKVAGNEKEFIILEVW